MSPFHRLMLHAALQTLSPEAVRQETRDYLRSHPEDRAMLQALCLIVADATEEG